MTRPSRWTAAATMTLCAALIAVASGVVPATGGPHLAGEWELKGRRDDGRVQLRLHHEEHTDTRQHSWSSSFDLRPEDIQGITSAEWKAADARVDARLVRDAGVFRLVGRMRRGEGSGSFTFEPDAAFRAEFQRTGYRGLTDENLARLALHDVGREWARGFETRGYRRMSLDELVRLRVHDVTPEFVDGMAAAGFRDIDVDELVRLRVHAVDPAYAQAMSTLGGGRTSTDELVRLKVHAVEPALVRELAALGLASANADELVRLQVHGVTPAFVREMGAAGWRNLAADDLVRLRVHGVTPTFARRAREKFGEVSVEDLIRLRQNTSL